MKICLQLSLDDWAALKSALLRLNVELERQGLAEHELTALLCAIEQDESIAPLPLKLAVIIQALLSQAITDAGCILGSVFLKTLIAQGWVVMVQHEYNALQYLTSPLPFAQAQATIAEGLGKASNAKASLAAIMQRLLWQSATGHWYIDTLAWSALQQRAHTCTYAAFNQALLNVTLLQQADKQWVTSAINALTPHLHIKQHQVLAAYHLAELYRIQMQSAHRLPLAERHACETNWKQCRQLLQQSHLRTQTQTRLTSNRRTMQFYFYQCEGNAMQRSRLASTVDTIAAKPAATLSTDTSHLSNACWVGFTGIATAGLGYVLWLTIQAALIALTAAACIPLIGMGVLTVCALSLFIYAVSVCIKDMAYYWQLKKQSKTVPSAAKAQPYTPLLSLELPLPAARKSNASLSVDHQPSIRQSSLLQQVGLYQSHPALLEDKTAATPAPPLMI